MKHSLREYLTLDERDRGYSLSWGAIFSGVVTFIALFFSLSLIGSAIGFGMFEPTSNEPLNGVGTGLLIWTLISLILSYLGAGFVSGVSASGVGLLHGFLTWCSSLIVMLFILSYMTIGVFSTVNSLLGNTTSAIGKGSEIVASGASDLVEKTFKEITSDLKKIDTDKLESTIEASLKDTKIPELQPDYLKNELSQATDDVKSAGEELVLHPENSDTIMTDLSNRLTDRVKKINDAIDEEAIANELVANSDLSQEEASKAAENITTELNKASKETANQIDKMRESIENSKEKIDESIKNTREITEDMSNTTSQASIWGFIIMVVGLVVTSLGGVLGSNYTKKTIYGE
ncbi:methyl-accepting chemotaxis protein [Vagococcus carniphilus]|uniref:methyl-accepting chemotaxis protein n=1 Tax=Vagococcus carniphilus TaxID=218144 RepID=UPI0028914592|nr:methyl-accepting chemotaxis protein [Vagococcus carniphilus]MDT2813709.1 methyl-accepting chemotaxis protein [Vagococcus carniphilus]MDT2848729.1 methyl-accepting chemotaxis protein [Vagococcus carniphilus]